jgi:hypothetical protein
MARGFEDNDQFYKGHPTEDIISFLMGAENTSLTPLSSIRGGGQEGRQLRPGLLTYKAVRPSGSLASHDDPLFGCRVLPCVRHTLP